LLVKLHPHIIVYRDGIPTGNTGIQIHTARHATQVATTINTRYDAGMLTVVVEDNLRKINIGNRLNRHFQVPYPAVAALIKYKPVEVTVA